MALIGSTRRAGGRGRGDNGRGGGTRLHGSLLASCRPAARCARRAGRSSDSRAVPWRQAPGAVYWPSLPRPAKGPVPDDGGRSRSPLRGQSRTRTGFPLATAALAGSRTSTDPCIPRKKPGKRGRSAVPHRSRTRPSSASSWIDPIFELRELRTADDRRAFLLDLVRFAACIQDLFFYPAAFMDLRDVQELSNFFERRVSAYQIGVTARSPPATTSDRRCSGVKPRSVPRESLLPNGP
jgi:hypothetical protein